jgi:hypothetical protein
MRCLGSGRRFGLFPDGVEDGLDVDVLALVFPLQLIQLLQYRESSPRSFTKARMTEVYLDCPFTVERAGHMAAPYCVSR